MMKKSKNRILLFGLAFFCVLLSFSQDITIDGGTVKCPAPLAAGYTKPIGSKTYHVVDLDALQSVINTGSYDVGAGTVTPTDLSCVCTTQITNMGSLFSGKESFNDDISNWDVSNVTNMNNMFNNARIFDQNISSWDVSSVETMQSMFENARAFNQNIDVWDVSSVTNMSSMFYNAFQFNQPIASAPNRWNVSNVSNFYAFLRGANSFNHPVEWGGADGTVRATSMWGMFRSNSLNSPITLNTDNVINMQTMFEGASIFNSPLNFSNTSKVKRMSWMFKNAVKFNQPLNFNTSSVIDMKQTFYNARDFNQNINNWDVGSVTNFESIFRSAEDFNQPLNNWNINTGSNVNMKQMFMSSDFNNDISSWDVSKVTNMQETFKSTPFDQDISSWNVSSLKNASSMFRYATAFNQDIGSWNTSSLENTIYMFGNASAFDQDIDGWDVSKVLRFGGMFQNAINFNQDLNSWITSRGETMNIMFDGATSFNGNISSWDLSNVTRTDGMFRNAQSFDKDISGWNTIKVDNIVEMFENADTFNQDIGGWDISNVESLAEVFNGADNFNQDLSNWNTTGVTNMNSTFKNSGFNHDISNWNTSSVTTFYRMFEGASTFNQNLNSWITSSAINMEGMFYRASNFDGDISSWDVSNVTNMKFLFLRAFLFNQDIGGWDISSVNAMDRMFEDATIFNQDIGPWRVNISDGARMQKMFLRASAFDHDISEWCVENIATEPNSFKVGSLLTDSTDPQWGVYVIRCDVTPPTVLTMVDSDSDNLLVETDVVQITVTFDEPMMDFPQYSIDGSNYQNLSKTTSSVWTYNFDVSTYSGGDGTISFTVSGTDLNYNAYAGSDKIDFIIDRVNPTLTLTDNHPDLLLNLSDSVLVQASFSESMRTPQLTMSPTLISNESMSVAGDDSNWTYTLNVSSLGASDGVYSVTVSGTDLAGNSYVGTESITYTLDVTTPTVVLYDDDDDNAVTAIDSITVTATFSESVQLTPTISLGSVVTNAEMNPTGSQDKWTYFFDFSLLTITPGPHPITVSGADIAGNPYSPIGGLLNGDETSVDTILLDYQLFTPSITVTNVTKIYERDSQFTLTATSTSGGAITFQKVDPSCSFISISGSDVTIIGAGTCQVKVSQAAFGAYRSAEVFININIEKADIFIETTNYEAECGDENFQLTASCSSILRQEDLVGSYNFNGSINDSTANQYNGIPINNPMPTNDRFGNPNSAYSFNGTNEIYFGDEMADQWSGSPDHFTISFWAKSNESSAKSIATLGKYNCGAERGTVIKLGNTGWFSGCNEGWNNIPVGSSASDGNWHHYVYTNDSRGRTFYRDGVNILNNRTQNLFNIKEYGLTIGGGYQNTAGTGDFIGSVDDVRVWRVGLSDEEVALLYNDQNTTCSRSDFIFTSLNTNIVSVTGTNTALITSSGDSVIQVTLPDDGNYNSATATFSLKVSKGDPIITQNNLTKNYGESFTLATSSTSDANLIYTITDTSIATVSGSIVTTKGAGSTTILVTQLENQCYNSISTSMTLDVKTVSQTVSWMADIYKIFGDELTLDMPITDSDYVGIISFSSSDPSIASVNSVTGEVIIKNVGAGSVILTAHLAADNNFDSATVTTSLFIDKSNQSIIVGTIPITKPLKDFSAFPLSAVASPSGAPVYIEVDPGSAATLSGTVGNYELVSINSTGLVTITFKTLAADHPNYNPASTVFIMDVIKSNQNIIVDPPVNSILYYSENLSYPINANTDSGLLLNYDYVSGAGASLTGNKLEINDIGEIIVDIKQPGNTEYNMAPIRRVIINVLQGITVLSDFNLPSKVFSDDDFTIVAPKSNRPGDIKYTSSNPSVAQVINGKIVINGVGSAKITAIQEANRLYTQGNISTVFFVGDTDIDMDGIGDSFDNCPGVANPNQLDTDGDTLGNLCDLDDDNDNWTDEIEGDCGSDPLDIDSYPSDNDYDGQADCIDTDDDNDGWSDQEEIVCNSDPFDSNIRPIDTDLDGISNCEDTDDDNDGWLDQEELNCNSDPLDSAIKPLDTDNDGISNCKDTDDDNDGWLDEEEINCGSDPLNETLYPIDTDNDGLSNCYDEDDDGDGWSDEIEEKCETNPLDVFDVPVDRDNDGDPSCTDPDDNQIFVSPLLTPGVNGPESTWKIINFEQYPSSMVKVFNRYGQVVFRKVNYQNDWAGTYDKTGELLPAGSYYYVVEVPETGKVKKGWLYLTY